MKTDQLAEILRKNPQIDRTAIDRSRQAAKKTDSIVSPNGPAAGGRRRE